MGGVRHARVFLGGDSPPGYLVIDLKAKRILSIRATLGNGRQVIPESLNQSPGISGLYCPFPRETKIPGYFILRRQYLSGRSQGYQKRSATLLSLAMVKPLSFKGEKKSKKRKAPIGDGEADSSSKALTVLDPAVTAEGDDSWVTAEVSSDIIGPIIFVLPSAKPTCIACDANGKVFTSELENISEDDPATAEPHDVRQVWVASRVAGMDCISFKGHHGRCVVRNFCEKPCLLATDE